MRHGLSFLGFQVVSVYPFIHFFCRRWDNEEGNTTLSFWQVGEILYNGQRKYKSVEYISDRPLLLRTSYRILEYT